MVISDPVLLKRRKTKNKLRTKRFKMSDLFTLTNTKLLYLSLFDILVNLAVIENTSWIAELF